MSVTSTPTVSVIMSVYNGEKYIARALLSLLAQTFTDFEIILVDDGSTDGTPHIVNDIKDSRIILIRQVNSGLTKSLNKALSFAKGRWIARHDADDFSISTRFDTQVKFLLENPDIGLLGSSCFIQPERHGIINEIYAYPEWHEEIVAAFTGYNPFVHGAMMMDKNLIISAGGYNEQYRYVQDYELWSRLVLNTQVHNLGDPLYVRSVHQESSQVLVTKEPIFNEIRDNFIKTNNYKREKSTVKQIKNISLYPAITLEHSWNKSISSTFYRMGKECRKQNLPSASMRMQSVLYYPWTFGDAGK